MYILVIDDDPEDCELFHEAVRQINPEFRSVQAVDGKKGLQLLEASGQELPNFIFLDINMPAMSGKECLMRLKGHPVFASIPVVMYSTTSNASEIRTFHNLGAQDFLVKPHDFETLVDSLRRIIVSA